MTRIVLAVCLTLAAADPALAQVKRVKVTCISGNVQVTGSSKVKQVTGTGQTTIKQSGDEVKVIGLEEDMSLTVPASVELVVKTRSAGITVSGVTGAVRAASVSGDLRVKGARRGVELKTVSGSVSLEQVKGRLRVKTVSGTVRASGSLSEMDVTSVSGDIIVEQLAGSGKARTTSGEVTIKGRLGKGARVKLGSHSGDVSLRLKVPAGAKYALRTFSGDLELKKGSKATAKRIESRKLEGSVGQGGASLDLATFSGDISLHLDE